MILPLYLLSLLSLSVAHEQKVLTNTVSHNSEQGCLRFQPHKIPNTYLINATWYPANAAIDIANLAQRLKTDSLPAFCRLILSVVTNTTANSKAITEVWLPHDWNGRYLQIGTGGNAGASSIADLGMLGIRQGFASSSNDGGHISSMLDGTWPGPGNDNAIVDFFGRAMHLSTVSSKLVVEQYYSKGSKRSYYVGCSNGGRQGLKEIQDYPEDYDGIVVGSPANWQIHSDAAILEMDLWVRPVGSPSWISPQLWSNVIHPEALRQCDAIDGLADGIISDPTKCHFDYAPLACSAGQDPSTCLTAPQLDALRKIYSDYTGPDGEFLSGRFYPGGELGMPLILMGPTPVVFGAETYQYLVLNDTNWDPATYTYEDLKLGDKINPGGANTINPDLRHYAGRGGKVIHYVGWNENLISAANSIWYYDNVKDFMKRHSAIHLDSFYRLFGVPGMQHCAGGEGANVFGGVGLPSPSTDAEHNMLTGLVEWVEQGTAPDKFIAVHYTNNSPTLPVEFSRPICTYPKSPVYVGGDKDEASSFKCA